jgi:hypothetical protein
MKKTLIILALAVTGFANAQKGSYLVAGNVTYNSTKLEAGGSESKASAFSFNPQVGYQFHENWTVGVAAGLMTQKTDNSNDNNQKVTNFTIGPFVRYTKAINETFSFYTDLGIGFTNRKETYEEPGFIAHNDATGLTTQLTPALSLNVKEGLAINFAIGGLYYNTLDYDGGLKSNQFGINFGQAFTVGIQKKF